MRLLPAAVVALALASCATVDIADGREPQIDTHRPGYWLWHDDHGLWHVRMTGGGGKSSHRFQGSITGASGSITELKLSDPDLEDHAARKGDVIEFDVELTNGDRGLDVRVAGGCLSFDLYFDSRRDRTRVRLGRENHHPPKIPFERCL